MTWLLLAALVVAAVFWMQPEARAARTVYDVQATPEENRQVKRFWEAHLHLPRC